MRAASRDAGLLAIAAGSIRLAVGEKPTA
jgi:hypothetical protein